MKPTAPSTKFARYATASAAALGAAAAADAQFTADYSLEPPTANTFNNPADLSTYGQWTFHQSNGNSIITTSNGASLILTADTASTSGADFTFSAVAAETGNVSFDYSTVLSGSGQGTFRYFVNAAYSFITGGTYSGPVTFSVSSGDTFGFRLTAAYANYTSMQATITNFSAPAAAVPEPGTAGLLVGVVSLGFVGLVAGRKLRERAAAPAAS